MMMMMIIIIIIIMCPQSTIRETSNSEDLSIYANQYV
jgi:hypothetical protein